MNAYQKELYDIFAPFQITRNEKPYPPYHKGKYLEEYFVAKYKSENIENFYFLPIHWTAVFNFQMADGFEKDTPNWNLRQKLFDTIKSLPDDKKYFTVSTHDDAPTGDFGLNTRHFYAGGNSQLGTDPIPLICSSYDEVPDNQKLIFCSFVGSATNPLRNRALQYFSNQDGYVINAFHWKPEVSKDQENLFFEYTSRSRFALCPRGYGATSYRLYEAMQLGAIPIYVSDRHLLPWSDELKWEEFAVVVKATEDYSQVDKYLKSLTETDVRNMQDKIRKVYPLYFTIPSTYNQIIKRLK